MPLETYPDRILPEASHYAFSVNCRHAPVEPSLRCGYFIDDMVSMFFTIAGGLLIVAQDGPKDGGPVSAMHQKSYLRFNTTISQWLCNITMRFFSWLDEHRSLGILILRLFVGLRLIYGVIDNVLSWERMLEFEAFLSKVGFPFPLVCAVLSVYAQLVAGVLYIIGWKIRYAALVMILNFSVAWIMVDRFGTIEQMTPALSMLFCSVLFLFVGREGIKN